MLEALPETLRRILLDTTELNRAYLVGGCVRDWLLKRPSKDFDIEVFGLDYETLDRVLARWGRTDLVGRSFGVIKLKVADGQHFDFTIPRRDNKVAPGHKGFEVLMDPDIKPGEAAARRDFTINALMYQARGEELLDFYGGVDDLRQGVLRHTSEAFSEDPLRVLRGMQLAARFNLKAAPETVTLCRRMADSHGELARERVWGEWFKWASASTVPSAGLRFLRETDWIRHYPQIADLVDTPQDPEWHPEGDVFIHTCHGCDALTKLDAWKQADPESRAVYLFAVLAHDFGKPATTQEADSNGRQRIVSPGHAEAGEALAADFLEGINAPHAVRERVLPLVTNHMAYRGIVTDRAVRRLARRLGPETINGLCLVITADCHGRPPLPREDPDGLKELQQRAEALQLQAAAPRPVLLGRHLLQRGWRPGPEMGRLLEEAFEGQLEGHFTDLEGALRWLDDNEKERTKGERNDET